jgi:hypothetical protein
MFTFLIVGAATFVVIILYACCAIAGKADDFEEKY